MHMLGFNYRAVFFPGGGKPLTAENSMLHLLRSSGEMMGGLQKLGCGIMLYSQQNIRHIEWDFVRLTCNSSLLFFLFSKQNHSITSAWKAEMTAPKF